ncbi:MAG: hypothetical protein U0903_05405 [Planctomycetales bacterium]
MAGGVVVEVAAGEAEDLEEVAAVVVAELAEEVGEILVEGVHHHLADLRAAVVVAAVDRMQEAAIDLRSSREIDRRFSPETGLKLGGGTDRRGGEEIGHKFNRALAPRLGVGIVRRLCPQLVRVADRESVAARLRTDRDRVVRRRACRDWVTAERDRACRTRDRVSRTGWRIGPRPWKTDDLS